jgi:hypothetical protein
VRLLSKQGGSPFNGISWNLNPPNVGVREIDNFRLALFVGGVDALAFGQSTEDLGADNSWTFVAATYDANALDNIQFFSGDETTPTAMLGDPLPAPAGQVASTAGAANFGIGFSDAARTVDTAADGFQDDVRVYNGVLTLDQIEAVRMENLTGGPTVDGDFNGDGFWTVEDLDELTEVGDLVTGVAATVDNQKYDLNNDDVINVGDVDEWLADGAHVNGFAGPYLYGDADLDGYVDGFDLLAWNAFKFTPTAKWSEGNFFPDGTVDAADYHEWTDNKFQSSPLAAVPEPGAAMLSLICVVLLQLHRFARKLDGGAAGACAR